MGAAGWEWKRGRILGIGGFSSVYVATKKDDGLQFAVKSVGTKARNDFEMKSLELLQSEIKLMARLQSKYIVRYLGHGFSSSTDFGGKQRETLDLYLEYLPKGNLRAFMEWHHQNKPRPMSEAWVAIYTLDILRGLEYLHKKQIVHGDIKGENVLFGSDCMKLVDFGSAKDCRASKPSSILEGTEGYMAPEVANKVESTFASDIFSLGCTVIEMATGQPLFETVKGKDYCKSIPKDISKEAHDFLHCCLKTNPKLRLSATQLLNHAFILKNFQSYRPRQRPRPKHSSIEFPLDSPYFDRRPPEDKCYRVPFVDKFQYSGPGSMVVESSEEFDDRSQLNEELHGEHEVGLGGQYKGSKALGMGNQEIKYSGFVATSMNSEIEHSATKQWTRPRNSSEYSQDEGRCGMGCCRRHAVNAVEPTVYPRDHKN